MNEVFYEVRNMARLIIYQYFNKVLITEDKGSLNFRRLKITNLMHG